MLLGDHGIPDICQPCPGIESVSDVLASHPVSAIVTVSALADAGGDVALSDLLSLGVP